MALTRIRCWGNSLAFQWLGLHALTAEGPGLIPGRAAKIPQAAQHGQKINQNFKKWSKMLGRPGEGIGSASVVFTPKLSQFQFKVLEAGAGRNPSAVDRKGV